MIRDNIMRTKMYLAVSACVVSTLGVPAVQSAVLEEVMVTAQKREQNMQDVGISVTAYSGDQLSALGMTNTVEITQQIPNMQLNAWSPTLTTFNIRGVSQNNFTDNLESPIAVYVDDAYVSSMNAISGQLFDMDRVEVLRGPQGTLFGRNATGGLVHYITNKATDEEFNGYVTAEAADYNRTSLEAAVGGSFSDSARGRFSARWEEADGYIESKPYPGNDDLPAASGQDIGGADGYALRGALQFDVGERTQIDVLGRYTKDDEVATGGYSFIPYGPNDDAYIPPEFVDFVTDVIGAPAEATADIFFCEDQIECFAPVNEAGLSIYEGDSPEPHEHYSDYEGYMDREIENYTLNIDHEFSSGLQFVSITNFSSLEKYYTEDGDGIPVQIIEFTTVADQDQWTQEFRLSGDSDRLRWQAGFFYMDAQLDASATTVGAPVFGVAEELGVIDDVISPSVIQNYELDSTNYSVFGQIEYDITDRLRVIAGYRWSQDDKEMKFTTDFADQAAGIFIPNTFDLTAAAAADGGNQDEIDYGDWAGRLQLDYDVGDDTLLFASYNRGIKGGNFTVSADVSLDDIQHDEEVLHSYEIGIKTELADGLARLNATAFYYDYKDYQAFSINGGTPQVSNSDAEAMGGEIELTLLPSDNWDIMLGMSFMDTEVDEVIGPQEQVTPVGFPVDWPVNVLRNNDLPNAPDFSVNYLVRYNFDALAGNIALQVDGAYYDDQWLEVTNSGGALQEAYSVSNARVTWVSASDSMQLTGWVKNFTDEEYKLYNLNLGILGSTAFYAPPRVYGVTATYRF